MVSDPPTGRPPLLAPQPHPMHSRVRELQPHVVRVHPHVVQLLAQEHRAEVLNQGCHPGRAGYPFPKAGLPAQGEGGLGRGRREGQGLLGTWRRGQEQGKDARGVGWPQHRAVRGS